MVDSQFTDYLKSEFRPNYVGEAVRRFETAVEWWDQVQDVLKAPRRVHNGVRIGHRWTVGGYKKIPHALYEITGMDTDNFTGAVLVTLSRVLKTKVSESQSNRFHVNLDGMRNHPDNRPFQPYNKIIDLLWEDWESDQ